MPRDKRILEVHGELAIIMSPDTPPDVRRSSGYYGENGNGVARLPIAENVIKAALRSYPSLHGPGGTGDVVAVKLVDLEKQGWVTHDDPPALRESGETTANEVRAGEAFQYIDRSGFENHTIMVSKGFPDDLPRGSGWLWQEEGHSHSPDTRVRLVPSYRSKTPVPKAKKATKAAAVVAVAEPKHGNSGRTYSFVTGKNPVDGKIGWKPTDLGGDGKSVAFDPVAPVMAVHDLMEHFPGDEYDPHNEYQAQGAMLWLRYEGGFFSKDGQTLADQVVRPAFGMLYHHIVKQKLETRLWDGKPEDADPFKLMKQSTAFELMDLISATRRYIDEVFRYEGTSQKISLDSLQRGVPWMVRGYARAAERYKGLDKSRLVKLYQRTVAQMSNVVEGATLKLTMSYEKYQSSVELSTPVQV